MADTITAKMTVALTARLAVAEGQIDRYRQPEAAILAGTVHPEAVRLYDCWAHDAARCRQVLALRYGIEA